MLRISTRISSYRIATGMYLTPDALERTMTGVEHKMQHLERRMKDLRIRLWVDPDPLTKTTQLSFKSRSIPFHSFKLNDPQDFVLEQRGIRVKDMYYKLNGVGYRVGILFETVEDRDQGPRNSKYDLVQITTTGALLLRRLKSGSAERAGVAFYWQKNLFDKHTIADVVIE